jgi:hypothetical protein
MHDYQTILPSLRREKRRDLDRDGLAGHLPISLGLATANLSQRWCRAIIGRMPSTFYIVAVCYATTVILLGLAPWNILLILLLFLGRNRRLRLLAFDMSRGSFL